MNQLLVDDMVEWLRQHPRARFQDVPRRMELTSEEYYEVIRRTVQEDARKEAQRHKEHSI